MRARKRIVVVGAGIIGSSIAWHLARKGAHVTVVCEKDGGVATPHSFSWINASWGNPEFYFHFRRRSMAHWRSMAKEMPGLPLQWCGSICWDLPPDRLEAFRREHESWGYEIMPLGAEAIAEREPELSHIPERALLAPEEGAVEPVTAARIMLADAEANGAERVTASVSGFVQSGGRATGVVTSQGMLAADQVIVAGGAGSAALATSAGFSLPIDVPPGLIVHSRPTRKRLRGLVIGSELHMRQTADGRIIAGSDFGGADPGEDPQAVAVALFDTLRSMLKDADDLSLEFYTLGYRPTPADGLPIIGEHELPGVTFAVMHSGVTLAPVVGDLLSDEVLFGRVDDALAPFRPGRFAKKRA